MDGRCGGGFEKDRDQNLEKEGTEQKWINNNGTGFGPTWALISMVICIYRSTSDLVRTSKQDKMYRKGLLVILRY